MEDDTGTDQTPDRPGSDAPTADVEIFSGPPRGRESSDPSGGTEPPDPGSPDAGAHDPQTPPHRLRRDTEHGLLGGVAAGVARYLDVDVVIVRVAFVALTILAGSGALIYVAAWLLMPADDDEHPLAQQWAGRRPTRRSLFVLIVGGVLALIALSDLFSGGLFSGGPWWPHHYGGVSLTLVLVALVLALALMAGSGSNRTAASRLRWFLLMALLSAVAVMVVAAATVFSIEAASGVPLRGGIGDTQWHPTTAGQLAPNYRLAMGNLDVDLSDVPFRPGTTHVTASVGIGHLSVEVPPGPTVSVVAHSGLGDVRVFGQGNGGLSTVQSMQSAGTGPGSRAHVVIDADAGVGQVDVIRTAGVSTFS